jgi:hypothetical protein
MKRLDRLRSFGEVFGEGATHSFEQDGVAFDHEGREVNVVIHGAAPAKTDEAHDPRSTAIAMAMGPAEWDPVVQMLSKKGADIIDELPDFSDEFLLKLYPVEAETKGRQRVLAAIEAETERRAKLVEQVNAQLQEAADKSEKAATHAKAEHAGKAEHSGKASK